MYPYHRRAHFRQNQDQRFFGPALLPFVAGSVLGLAASPFFFGRPYYPYYPPYPVYPGPYPYGYGGVPYQGVPSQYVGTENINIYRYDS